VAENSKATISIFFTAILATALIAPWTCFVVQAQTESVFVPADKFSIPQSNGTISFSVSGTYEAASLENGSWIFLNLHLNNSLQLDRLNLTFSAENSNVTITNYRTYNDTYGGVMIRYLVSGQGKQTFYLGPIPKVGEWSVNLNRVYVGLNEGWTVSPDSTITVTGAITNASLSYYTIPNAFGNPDSSNMSFYQQHSVVIATLATLTITIAIAVVIWRRNRNKN
jgi:hypothetical protein